MPWRLSVLLVRKHTREATTYAEKFTQLLKRNPNVLNDSSTASKTFPQLLKCSPNFLNGLYTIPKSFPDTAMFPKHMFPWLRKYTRN